MKQNKLIRNKKGLYPLILYAIIGIIIVFIAIAIFKNKPDCREGVGCRTTTWLGFGKVIDKGRSITNGFSIQECMSNIEISKKLNSNSVFTNCKCEPSGRTTSEYTGICDVSS